MRFLPVYNLQFKFPLIHITFVQPNYKTFSSDI